MRRGGAALAACLFAAAAAGAQPLPAELLAADAVGRAHAMLLRSAPCFRDPQAERRLWALLEASLGHIAQRPEAQQAYQRGMTETQNQQRHIPRSDPVACREIAGALGHFMQRHGG